MIQAGRLPGVVAVRPGPVITTFEFEPAPGVKVNRIVGLADDLSMALRALSVRVLAPIPGKPVVGIEVSNPSREKVFIRDLLQSDDYRRAESHIALERARALYWRSLSCFSGPCGLPRPQPLQEQLAEARIVHVSIVTTGAPDRGVTAVSFARRWPR